MSAFHAFTSETSALSDAFEHVSCAAVELARFLALGDDRAEAGAGEERRDAGAAGAQALGERALRVELEFEFAGEVLAFEFLVLADVGRNHLADLARAPAAGRGRSRRRRRCWRRGEALDAGVAQRVDQRFGNAAQAEAADRDVWPSLTRSASAAASEGYTLFISSPPI